MPQHHFHESKAALACNDNYVFALFDEVPHGVVQATMRGSNPAVAEYFASGAGRARLQ